LIDTVKTLLLKHNINPTSSIEYDVNGSLHVMTLQEITEPFSQASPESREIFIQALEKALQEGKIGAQNYFEKMGELLLRSALSKS